MPGDLHGTAIRGSLIHTPVLGEVEIRDDVLLLVDDDGNIERVVKPGSPQYAGLAAKAEQEGKLVVLGAGQYLVPGLIDLHVHAPQWPQLGKALDLPLYEWLQQCTFPLEAKYTDLDFARTSYESLVSNLLANGTTTAAYYGTIHVEATVLLAEIAAERGQRAVVGKVAMDNPDQCPDFLSRCIDHRGTRRHPETY